MVEDVWNRWNEGRGTKYPQDRVVEFCLQHPPTRYPRALDLGCGSGVHTVLLAEQGFDVMAIDGSPVGVENTRQTLRERGLRGAVRLENADVLDFPRHSFDLVICVGVYDSAGATVAAESLRRVRELIRPGGCGFFLFATDEDDAVKGDNPWGFHGFSRPEVDALFAWPSSVWIDRRTSTSHGGRERQDEWIVTLQA